MRPGSAAAGTVHWRSAFGDRPGIFVACLVVWTLTNLDQSLFGYSIPGILTEFHLPLQAAGTILTISFLFAPIPIILSGMASDRFGRGLMLWLLLALSALCVGLQGAAGGIISLTVFRALGFGISGGLSPITNTIVIENASARFRGVAMGVLQCGYPIGWFIASLIAEPVLRRYDWRVTCYAAFAVIPLAMVIGRLVKVRPPVPVSEAERAPADAGSEAAAAAAAAASAEARLERRVALRRLFSPELRTRSLASIAMFFTFGGAYAGSVFFFTSFFVQARHYTPADAAWVVGLSNGVGVIGYLSAAFVGEFILTRRNVFTLWCIGGALSLLGLLWLSTNRTEDIIWYSLMATLFFGSQAVVATFVAEVFPTAIRTTALAVCTSAPLSLGFAVFPMAVPAVIAALGWERGLSLVIVPLLIGAGLLALLLPNRRSGLEYD